MELGPRACKTRVSDLDMNILMAYIFYLANVLVEESRLQCPMAVLEAVVGQSDKFQEGTEGVVPRKYGAMSTMNVIYYSICIPDKGSSLITVLWTLLCLHFRC